jgi:hypothetical protein
MRSDRGSEFWRCLLADVDARFVKYPRLPVVRCAGFLHRPERVNADTEKTDMEKG